jgi:hypothetical protein
LRCRLSITACGSAAFLLPRSNNSLACRRAFKSTQRCALNFTQGL